MPGCDDLAVHIKPGFNNDFVAARHAGDDIGTVRRAVRICKDIRLPLVIVDHINRDEHRVLSLLRSSRYLDGNAGKQRPIGVLNLRFDREQTCRFIRLCIDRGNDRGVFCPALCECNLVSQGERDSRVGGSVELNRHGILVGDRIGGRAGRGHLIWCDRFCFDHAADRGINLVFIQCRGALLQ